MLHTCFCRSYLNITGVKIVRATVSQTAFASTYMGYFTVTDITVKYMALILYIDLQLICDWIVCDCFAKNKLQINSKSSLNTLDSFCLNVWYKHLQHIMCKLTLHLNNQLCVAHLCSTLSRSLLFTTMRDDIDRRVKGHVPTSLVSFCGSCKACVPGMWRQKKEDW